MGNAARSIAYSYLPLNSRSLYYSPQDTALADGVYPMTLGFFSPLSREMKPDPNLPKSFQIQIILCLF